MNNNIKSATTAGLLGIFLGSVGAHNWYLGDKKKGTQHVIIFGIGAGLMIVANVILPSMMSWYTFYKMGWLIALLSGAGWLAMAASEVWGFIEGIQILTAGDAGLARRGYVVAQQNFGQNNMGGNQYNNQNAPFNGQNNGNGNGMNGGNMNNSGMNGNINSGVNNNGGVNNAR